MAPKQQKGNFPYIKVIVIRQTRTPYNIISLIFKSSAPINAKEMLDLYRHYKGVKPNTSEHEHFLDRNYPGEGTIYN